MLRRRRLRNYELQKRINKTGTIATSKSPRDKVTAQDEEVHTDNIIDNKFNFSGSQDQVKLIQKNVRGWLLRRQFQDTKYAVKILQSRKILSSDFKELFTKVKDQ